MEKRNTENVLNEIHIKLKKNIYTFEYFKLEKKMAKMGFEHWLFWSDYTLDDSLAVTAKADAC